MDTIIEDINGFGKYQKIVLLIIGAMSSLNAMAIYAIFIAAEPELTCHFKDEYNNNNSKTFYNDQKCEIWKNFTKSKELNIMSPYKCEWDTKYYGLTIINEWQLICDRAYLAGLTQVFNFFYNLIYRNQLNNSRTIIAKKTKITLFFCLFYFNKLFFTMIFTIDL